MKSPKPAAGQIWITPSDTMFVIMNDILQEKYQNAKAR